MGIVWLAIGIVSVCLVACVVLLAIRGLRRGPIDPVIPPTPTPQQANRDQGAAAKRTVHGMLVDRLPHPCYRVHRHVTIPARGGAPAATIDHVVVSRFGVFAVHTVSWSGLLEGDADADRWAQRIRTRFHLRDNPIPGTRRAAARLTEMLDLAPGSVHPVLCFAGHRVSFNKPMPPDVVRADGLVDDIMSFHRPILTEEVVDGIDHVVGERSGNPDRWL